METKHIRKLFDGNLAVINMGLASFADNLHKEGTKVVQMDWRPGAGGDPEMQNLLDRITTPDGNLLEPIAEANQKALERLQQARPVVTGIGVALKTIPGMHKHLILHAGPPVTWERMSGPTRGAVIGGLIYEGLANTQEEAEHLAASGSITFEPCHHHDTVGPMAGVVTASMPVWILENQTFGNKAYCTLNEGLGKVLRYGAFSEEVIQRLRWMETVLTPILTKALASHGPLDMRNIIAQALQMGDECHNRNRAATSLVIRALAPHLATCGAPPEQIREVFSFLDGNDHFFLNLSMPACKCAIDPCHKIKNCSMVTVMARSGTDFGIRISALGDEWFTAPAPMVEGLYLPGFTADDAAPDIGDSVITETAGIGGFAMASAPAIVQFVGGNAVQAIQFTKSMYTITLGEHPQYRIPALDFKGTPTGIELTRIVDLNLVPVVNTGIAHKNPGIGMVGAGLVKPPISCFKDALRAFVEQSDG